MKKRNYFFLVAVLLAVALSTLVACGGATFEVSFDLDGVRTQRVSENESAVCPLAETATHTVVWCEDEGLTRPFDFESPISTDLKLYAKLSPKIFALTFDTAGGGANPAGTNATYGDTVALPAAPVRNGYDFGGWTDGVATYDAGADYTINANATLVAKWNYKMFTVSFVDESGELLASKKVPYGSDVVTFVPEKCPDGYFFANWSGQKENIVRDTELVANFAPLTSMDGNFSYTANDTRDGYIVKWTTRFSLVPPPETVTFPESYMGVPCTEVGTRAFDYYDIMQTGYTTKFVLPDSYLKINANAFNLIANNVKEIVWSENLVHIGDNAFVNLEALEKISEISAGCTYIGKDAFIYCSSLKRIDVNEKNLFYASVDGVLFNKERTMLIKIPNGFTAESYTVAVDTSVYGVWDMAENAIHILTADVTGEDELGRPVYTGRLPKIVLPEGLKTIMPGNFYMCPGLVSLNFPSTLEVIGENDGFTEQMASVFSWVGLKELRLNEGLRRIGVGAFANNSTFETIYLPSTLTSLGDGVFKDSGFSVIDVVVAEGNKFFATDGRALYSNDFSTMYFYFSGTEETEYSVNFRTRVILGGAFDGATRLETITIPEGVKIIEDNTFRFCLALKTVNLPSTLIELGTSFGSIKEFGIVSYTAGVFGFCENLTNINFPNGCNVEVLGFGLFYEANVTSFTIPASVTELRNTFVSALNLTEILVAEGNTMFKSIDGVLYSADGKTLLTCPVGKTGKHEVVAGTETIGEAAFLYSKLTNLILPEGIKRIKNNAFWGMICLTELVLPASLKYIEEGALANMYIREITFLSVIPPTVEMSSTGSHIVGYVINVPAESVDDYRAHEAYMFCSEIRPISEEESKQN